MSAKSSLKGNDNFTATRPPISAASRPPTTQLFSRGNLVSSRLGGDKTVLARPSTAVRAVGYAANSDSAGQRFNQLFLEKTKQKTLSAANAAAEAAKEVNPQIKYKNLEAKIVKLLETSIILTAQSSVVAKVVGAEGSSGLVNSEAKAVLTEALNKAKEAFSLDRTLHRFRDQHGENIFHNFDLTYAVFFNLAKQYENNDMHVESLNIYSIMTKNKMFPHVNQLKLNMGNIYYKMGIYPKAIKMYRMALDSVPNNLKQLRLKITQNIGILFVRMGQYTDAAASFEFVMSERADIRSGIHLILCYYALGDVDKIKSTFRNMCDVQPMETDNELENENNLIKLQQHAASEQQRDFKSTPPAEVQLINDGRGFDTGMNDNDTNPMENGNSNNDANNFKYRYILQALKSDELAIYTKQNKNNDKRAITMIVDLISPIIEENYNDGYNWCIEIIKTSNLSWLANELELNKALVYLRQNDVNQAIETLQMCDRKSKGFMTANALTNLSFIYINLGNLEMATHCVNQLNEIGALKSNAMALNNAAIIDTKMKNYAAGRHKLEKALEIQPDNFEANYNLGLLGVEANDLELAKAQFEYLKTQHLIPQSVQHSHVLYQLARIQEKMLNTKMGVDGIKVSMPTTLQSYLQVLGASVAEIDSRLFEKVGTMYEQLQDYQEANQYYHEAYRINPSDISIANSIGSYYIKLQATEKAIYYYERAVLADPNDPSLMLRIASCFRNSYLPPKQYLEMFEKVYNRFPENLTCVRSLMQVTKSMGMTELYEKYTLEYERLHRLQIERQNEKRYQQERLNSAASERARLKSSRSNIEDSSPKHKMLQSFDSTGSITSKFNGERYLRTTAYADPIGPLAERPRTGMLKSSLSNNSDDEEMNADSLLPI
ncbi:intraflagellar transport protein 88 homolog [Teleopsis dalmanni]|uniref:intraflagellar transport protein 88 homolog n=1 Tax=Teleopsis dalmanni TaxID=139649 RepID=UPI0018CEB362|nr:intraflagellar transport protein 88 homolog [Teleopsis dalmanni]